MFGPGLKKISVMVVILSRGTMLLKNYEMHYRGEEVQIDYKFLKIFSFSFHL